MRLLMTLLLIVTIGAGASIATQTADFDTIKKQLTQSSQPDSGSQAAEPTPTTQRD